MLKFLQQIIITKKFLNFNESGNFSSRIGTRSEYTKSIPKPMVKVKV